MSPEPITKVYDAEGQLVHDCADAGCDVSWDGYALRGGLQVEQPDESQPDGIATVTLAEGDRLHGADDPGAEWHTPGDGTARNVPG